MRIKDELKHLYNVGKFPQLSFVLGFETEVLQGFQCQIFDIHSPTYYLNLQNILFYLESAILLSLINSLK